MRLHLFRCLSLVLLAAACAGSEEEMDDAATTTEAATLSAADFRGVWEGESFPENSDSAMGRWRFEAPADTTAWTLTFLEGDSPTPNPVRIVAISGDSLVTELNATSPTGEPMFTRAVGRIENGRYVGTWVAHPVSAPDSIVRGRFEGSLVP